jgi:hypothetical protein
MKRLPPSCAKLESGLVTMAHEGIVKQMLFDKTDLGPSNGTP